MTQFRITIEPWAGARIQDCCTEAIELAKRLHTDIRFEFNETAVIVHADDAPDALYERWQRDYEANRPK